MYKEDEQIFHDHFDYSQAEKFKLLADFEPILHKINTLGNLEFTIQKKKIIKNDSIVKEINLKELSQPKPNTTELF